MRKQHLKKSSVKCNINYQAPSTGTESMLMLECFQESESKHPICTHNWRCKSSTFKKLNESRIYRNPELKLEKLEFVLHLDRNLRKKIILPKVVKTSQKDVTTKLEKKVREIIASRNYWNSSNDSCAKHLCQKWPNRQYNNKCWRKMECLKKNQTMVFNANLLKNENFNIAEQFNSIIAKAIGGKRINLFLGQSYSNRVNAAFIQHSSGWISIQLKVETENLMLDELDHSTLQIEYKRWKQWILRNKIWRG